MLLECSYPNSSNLPIDDDRITLLQKSHLMYPYTHMNGTLRAVQYFDRRLPLFARNLRDWSTGSRLADLIGHHTVSTFTIVKQMLPVVLLLSISVVPRLMCNSVRSHTSDIFLSNAKSIRKKF